MSEKLGRCLKPVQYYISNSIDFILFSFLVISLNFSPNINITPVSNFQMVSHGEKIDAFTLTRSQRLKVTNKYPEKLKLIGLSVSKKD